MGITYKDTLARPGDTFPVLIRKMAQKLGVGVDIGDNVYRVMWNVLANQDWVFGVSQSHVNVANKNVSYTTTPRQGDTLNVLFLKFAIRTGYVIITRDGHAVPQSHDVLSNVVLDPENVPGGGNPFDPTLCQMLDILGGGGTTFECYDVGPLTDDLAGTGIVDIAFGDSVFKNVVGVTFDLLPEGEYISGSIGADAEGVDSTIVGDSSYGMLVGVTFNTLPLGTYSSGDIGSDATGVTSTTLG